ncbi:hypothetical protein [Streptomyces hydrogenans]|uniref:hypothetical protein n=1 Tax=Streptomyces hydrogenans TaxID=1873719 RepID=UPI00382BFB30
MRAVALEDPATNDEGTDGGPAGARAGGAGADGGPTAPAVGPTADAPSICL